MKLSIVGRRDKVRAVARFVYEAHLRGDYETYGSISTLLTIPELELNEYLLENIYSELLDDGGPCWVCGLHANQQALITGEPLNVRHFYCQWRPNED